MAPDLSAAERWIFEQLADDDHHLAHLGWLGGDQYEAEAAIEVLQSLLIRGEAQQPTVGLFGVSALIRAAAAGIATADRSSPVPPPSPA
jgi:hypothetical protein